MNSRKSKRNRMSKMGKRFLTLHDMAIVKRDDAIKNSQIKRGELVPKGENHYIVQCGCGGVGCFIHGSSANVEQT